MGMLNKNGLPGGGSGIMPPLTFDVKPRVFVRKPGEEYSEIAGVKSFERIDDEGSSGIIKFALAGGLDGALKDMLARAADNFVDVKMEFLIGMLMVMTFSGFVDHVSDDTVSFALSTPIATDVQDVAQ